MNTMNAMIAAGAVAAMANVDALGISDRQNVYQYTSGGATRKSYSGGGGTRKKCNTCGNIMFDNTPDCYKCRCKG